MPTSHSTAQSRLLDLLELDGEIEPDMGFVDLLGASAQVGSSTGIAARLMLTRVVPWIYERYWRPALGRVAKGLNGLNGLNGPSMAGEIAIARNLLGLRTGHTVVDVGCGTGRFTRAFGAAVGPGGLAIGLDGSRTMLTRASMASKEGVSVTYLRADAVTLPFRPSTVDAVCCFAALHMFADPDTALDSFTSTLRPGGRVALFTSARRSWPPARLLDTAGGIITGQRMFDRGEVAEKLRRRGFSDVSERYAGVTQIVAGTRGAATSP